MSPPKSKRQQRFLFANKPGLMKKWRAKYGKKGVKPTGGMKKKRGS